MADLDNDGIPNTLMINVQMKQDQKNLVDVLNLPGSSISSFLNNYSEFFFDFDSYEIDDKSKNLISANLSKILMKYETYKN